MRRVAVLVILIVLAGSCSSDDGGGDGATTTNDTATAAGVRVVSQNILHGQACAADTNLCDLPARVELFLRQLDSAGCPELVSLQEANGDVVRAVSAGLSEICDGRYELVWDNDPGLDREVVLSTLPVLGTRRDRLAGLFRDSLWVRVKAEVGVVEFVTTHLASSSDDRPCDAVTCTPPCEQADRLQTCQARQIVDLIEAHADPEAVVVFGGDLNATVGEPTIDVFAEAGFVDTHLAAGNAECDPESGAQCTGGRVDSDLSDLTDEASRQRARIDYIWLAGRRECELVAPTGLFNALPADPELGAGRLLFPSDHTAVEASLSCPTTAEQRAASGVTPLPPAPTTSTTPPGAIDASVRQAVTAAFEGLFSGAVSDVDEKLSNLEDGELLRDSFVARYEATKEIASRITVRIDSVSARDADHVDVVYSLLLDGNPVLDHLPGGAVRVGGRWLVTRRTYCDVGTQGTDDIPEACRS